MPNKSYSVPAVMTIAGWVKITADSKEAALKEAERLNTYGVADSDILDASYESELQLDEIEELEEEHEA